MTLLDLIKLGLIKSDAGVEKFAADLIDCWHDDKIPGELNDILGLSSREYQAWTTGGVSLLTIAHWHKTSHPPLDVSKPWFKLSGRPPQEVVGYLEQKTSAKAGARRKASARRIPQSAASSATDLASGID
jgi:hypothetical protein